MQSERFRLHAQPSSLSWGSDSPRIAVVAEETWREIRAAMTPVIGERGFSALVKRSLYLRRNEYAWLTASYVDTTGSFSFDGMREATLQQSGPAAAAAHAALIETFCHLLHNLVGEALTQRLLNPVWNRAPREQEDTP